MADWDHAFVWDALARAYRTQGKDSRAEECVQEAQKAAERISDPEDRKVFDSWHKTY